MTHIGVIPKDLAIGPFWPQISDLISKAMPYGRGEYTIDDIREGIASGAMFALGVIHAGTVEFVITATIGGYWREVVGPAIEAARINGKDALDSLTDPAMIDAHVAAVVADLDAI